MTRIFSLLVVLGIGWSPVALAHETEVTHEEPAGSSAANGVKQRVRQEHKEDLAAARAAKDAFKRLERTESDAKQLAAVKLYGQKMIEVRLKVLASYPARQNDKQCSSADRQAIGQAVVASQAILTSAKDDLAASTEADKAKLIIKSAIEKTRVFAVWAPATNGLCRTSRLIALIDGRLTKAVNVLKVAGQDVGELSTLLLQAKAKVTAAHGIYQGLVAAPNYPDTTAAKEKFALAKSELNEAKDSLNKFKSILIELKKSLKDSAKPPQNEKTEVTP